MSKEAMDMLMGGGGASQSWPTIGTECKGRLAGMERRQSSDINGNKEFWPDGDIKYQIVYTIETGIIDPSIEDDDGVRRVYSKKNIDDAVRDAVRKSGFKGDLIGGKIGIKYVGDGPPKQKGYNGPKLFAARYEPPTQADMLDETIGREEQEEAPAQASSGNPALDNSYTQYGEEPF